jgi:uncharacterized protein YdaU (DUF1376 family)
MSQAPSMPMFWDAYLADTTHLSLDEHGAYLLLLAAMWRRNGSVPDDDKDNARILGISVAKWKKVKARLNGFLIFENNEISQKKLQETWSKTQEKIEKNRENGAKGGRPKSKENNTLEKANGSVSVNPNETIPEPEPEPIEEPPKTPKGEPSLFSANSEHEIQKPAVDEIEEGFEEWWGEIWPSHPRKSGRADCRKIYRLACTGKHSKADKITPSELNRATRDYIASVQDVQYLKGPLPWLRQPGWEPFIGQSGPVPMNKYQEIIARNGGRA